MLRHLDSLIRLLAPVAVGMAVCAASPVTAQLRSEGVEGFLEPYQTIDIAAPEPGLLKAVLVREGDVVATDTIVAELNNDVLEAALRVATKTAESTGKLESTRSELRLSETLLQKLTDLRDRGLATAQEIERATVERDVAAARLLATEVELAVRKLEAQRIEREIEARRLRSPIPGVMTRQWKDAGEYVSPSEPVVVTVVQLDPLLAVFSVPQGALAQLQVGGMTTVSVGDAALSADGVVEFISPLVDPRSGTAQIKIRIANPAGRYLSGERCQLLIATPEVQRSTPPSATPSSPKPVSPILSVPVN